MVSTGDDSSGLRWRQVPALLRCYALGDIKFGFIAYNVLAGVLLRDVLPDLDMICRYLRMDQQTDVTWFLNWILISLKGADCPPPPAKEGAHTHDEMFRSLRFCDDHERFCVNLQCISGCGLSCWACGLLSQTEDAGSWHNAESGI